MAIRNNQLGGTDWDDEVLFDFDLNDTIDAVVENTSDSDDKLAVGIAQNSYQILDSSNTFTNRDYLATDQFTDSDGINNTVNTGSTTAYFDTDSYILDATAGTNESLTGDNSSNTYNDSWCCYTTYGTCLVRGYISKVTYKFGSGSSGDPGHHKVNIKKNGTVIASYYESISNSTAGTKTVTFTKSDYSDFFEPGDTYELYVEFVNDGDTEYLYYQSGVTSTGNLIKKTSQDIFQEEEFTQLDYNSSDTVVCDTNTITLDSTETKLAIYGHKDTPTNTNITVDISDGSTTLSGKSLNSTIDISSLSSGTLKLTFNLSTTDTNTSPALYGYGVYVIK